MRTFIRATCLLAYALLLSSCSTLITSDYLIKHQELAQIRNEMTTQRALDIIRFRFPQTTRHYCSPSSGDAIKDPGYTATTVTSIDPAGVDYDFYSKSNPIYLGETYQENQRYARYTDRRETTHHRLRFPDVIALKIRHDLNQLRLLDDQGRVLYRFNIAVLELPNNSNLKKTLNTYQAALSMVQSPMPFTSHDEVNELFAALLFVCPNLNQKTDSLRHIENQERK